ncbi:MAG: hypothetical protein KTR31_11160 [Myxococcales bacterium]|nr:hypothetical protein [Myxococcales bacterium]
MIQFDDQVASLRWTGRTWWGAGAPPEESGGLGDPERPSYLPWFVASDDALTLRWLEHDDGRGPVVAEAQWTATGWSQRQGRVVDTRPRAKCGFRDPPAQWSAERTEFDVSKVVATCGANWDWEHGTDEPRHLAVVAKRTLRLLSSPDPGTCGHDAPAEICMFLTMGKLPSGDVVAVAQPYRIGEFNHPAPKPMRILRWDDDGPRRSRWSVDAILSDVPPYAGPRFVEVDPPVVAFMTPSQSYATMWGHDGTRWGPLGDDTAFAEEDNSRNEATLIGASAVAAPEGVRWIAWWSGFSDYGLSVAEHTSRGWVRRDVGWRGLGGGTAMVEMQGVPVVAWGDDEGLYVVVRNGDRWVGLDGPGSNLVWRGSVWHPALTLHDGQLCVAWAGSTERETQVGVLCRDVG